MTPSTANYDATDEQRLCDAIDADDREMLSWYVADNLTTQEIGERLNRPRRTVSYRLARSRSKLKAIGFEVPWPKRGRRPHPDEPVSVDPSHMNNLAETANGSKKWISSRGVRAAG